MEQMSVLGSAQAAWTSLFVHSLQVQLYQVQLSTRGCTHRPVALLCAIQGDETVEKTLGPEVRSFLSTAQVVSYLSRPVLPFALFGCIPMFASTELIQPWPPGN